MRAQGFMAQVLRTKQNPTNGNRYYQRNPIAASVAKLQGWLSTQQETQKRYLALSHDSAAANAIIVMPVETYLNRQLVGVSLVPGLVRLLRLLQLLRPELGLVVGLLPMQYRIGEYLRTFGGFGFS